MSCQKRVVETTYIKPESWLLYFTEQIKYKLEYKSRFESYLH